MTPSSRVLAILLTVSITCMILACGGSPGVISDPIEPSATFVEEEGWLYAQSAAGAERMRLDGSERELLWRAAYHAETAMADGSLFVLGDSQTNLYLYAPGRDARPRQIHALDGRASAVALSPDGATLAASRHADYSAPQTQWSESEDDAIYLIDTSSGEVEVLPARREGWILQLRWPEPETLTMSFRPKAGGVLDAPYTLDLASGELSEGGWEGIDRSWRHERAVCGGEQLGADDQGIYLEPAGTTRAGEGRRYLIHLKGKKRGFHDYLPPFSLYTFTPSCAHLLFIYEDTLYIHQLATHKTAALGPAHDAWTMREASQTP